MRGAIIVLLIATFFTDAKDSDAIVPEELEQNPTVHTANPNEIHAELAGLGFHGKVTGENSGDSHLYDTGTKQSLLSLHTEGNTAQVRFGHDAPFNFVITPETLNVNPADAMSFLEAINKASVAKFDAGMKSLEFSNMYPKIVALSKALGIQGYQGNTHAVTLWLHNMAVETMKKSSSDVVELAQTDEQAETKMGYWRRRRRRFTPKFARKPINFCGNKCFGLCGNGCSCWKHVCGDCLSHQGCWEHDAYCSCCGTANHRCRTFMANSRTCNSPGCANKYCAKKAHTKFECNWGCGGATRRRRRL
jgi:hypothetical protein